MDPRVRLKVERLEERVTPGLLTDIGDFFDGALYYSGAVMEGVANLVNGVQDMAIGVANLPGVVYNNTLGNLGGGRIGIIPSPDWSRDLIVQNDPLHDTSKFLGGTGALTLLTVGASTLGRSSTVVGEAGGVGGEAGAIGGTGVTNTTTVNVAGSSAEITTVNGVATVEIGFLQNASRDFMGAVVNTARQQGATTLIVETGPVVNADLAIKLGLAASRGETVLGGIVSLLPSATGAGTSPLFRIVWQALPAL